MDIMDDMIEDSSHTHTMFDYKRRIKSYMLIHLK